MTHKKLVEIGYRWCLRRGGCGIAFKELDCASNGETPDVLGFSSWGHSVLIECKMSRNDFLSDKKKMIRQQPERGMGRYRFYLCPIGLIKIDELPERWGLIEVDCITGKAKMVHDPLKVRSYNKTEHPYNIEAEHQFLYSALRRLFIRGLAPQIYKKEYKRCTPDDIINANTESK